ncbi:hypothetical protein SLEP1_g51782 [Rubroshorea leprosula]|uniref:Uncharacterized protein n=1 Tax=Rubroshorea leprosula TaxID=152421 RepID=A0AAV5M4C4_9ROSI|nr:hypothetical protein SLEP1_g51782 [Rubroshorea leprosula]
MGAVARGSSGELLAAFVCKGPEVIEAEIAEALFSHIVNNVCPPFCSAKPASLRVSALLFSPAAPEFPPSKPPAPALRKPVGSLDFSLFSCSRTEKGTQKPSPPAGNPDLLLLCSSPPAVPCLWVRIALIFCSVSFSPAIPAGSSPSQARFLQLEILVWTAF